MVKVLIRVVLFQELVGLVVGEVKTHPILVVLEHQIKVTLVAILAPLEQVVEVVVAQVKLVTLLLQAMKQPEEGVMDLHLA